jgi:hypothetical protein
MFIGRTSRRAAERLNIQEPSNVEKLLLVEAQG